MDGGFFFFTGFKPQAMRRPAAAFAADTPCGGVTRHLRVRGGASLPPHLIPPRARFARPFRQPFAKSNLQSLCIYYKIFCKSSSV